MTHSTAPAERTAESPFDAIRRVRADGSEYWAAREMQPLMGYSQWSKLKTPLTRAMATAKNQGMDVAANFARSDKVAGQSGPTPEEYELSRMAAYLLAMNGDPNKPEVAAAQLYFATKTREAEAQTERPVSELEMAYRYIAALEREQSLLAEKTHLVDKVAELSPKAEGYDDLLAADGYLDLGAAAKALASATGGIGRTRFINLLRGMGIVMQDSTLPYQHLIDRGYFAVRTSNAGHPYTVVTAKGLRWLQAELREDRPTLEHGNILHLPASGNEENAS
jgi:DNA-damage-inducible protein D